jgi:raffinose/stachyose/melibiose transport system permease protein
MNKNNSQLMDIITKSIVYILAFMWLIITIYPLIFLVQNSFKSLMEFLNTTVWAFPEKFSLINYQRIIEKSFYKYFLNSAFVVSIAMVLILILGSIASFGLARIKFRLRSFFYYVFISGLTISVHVTLIPVYVMTRNIHLYDTRWALIGPYVAVNLPITIFILVAFMEAIPLSLEEAAFMDGAKHIQVYWHIVLPISRPALTAVGIFNAVGLWNEFIFALVLISTEKLRTLTLALWTFNGEFAVDVPAMMTILFVSMVPLLIFYAIVREKLIEGLTAGALKG